MNKILIQLDNIISSLKDLEVDKIILIGSYAKNNYNEDSDLDLVVVLDKNTIPSSYNEKMADRLLVRRKIYSYSEDIPIDLIVYTKAEYQEIAKIKTSFFQEISLSGKILYEKTG